MQYKMNMLTAIAISVAATQVTEAQAEKRTFSTPPKSVANVELTKPQAGSGEFKPSEIGLISRSSKLLGHKVQDENARGLGTLTDILVHLPSGKVVGCIVEADDNQVLVPPSAFFPVSEDRVVFNAERNLLKSAPKATRADAQSKESLEAAYKVFNQPLPSGAQAPMSVKQFIGRDLLASTGSALGKIEDLVVDIPKGEAVYVVVRPRTGGTQLYAVPPTALQASDSGVRFSLNQTESQFMTGPNVPSQFWTEMTLPKFAESVYRHYGIVAQEKQAQRSGLTPTGRSDDEVRNAILSQIVSSPSMSAVNAKKLQITARNGTVTLSGTVGSQGAREELVGAAAKVVGPANVDDRLKVK